MKKRYSLTLTQEYVEEFQRVSKLLGMPPAVMSTLCDEAVQTTAAMFKKAHEQGSFTMSDMFKMMGELVEETEQPKLIK